ncbi:MAG: hypothetical protein L6V93_15390 [Clostridiales bacterium]|nr:MAG: hypothetical protein L6V93_15390 [Clostridiales bacterium]
MMTARKGSPITKTQTVAPFAYKNGNFYIGSGNVPEKGVAVYCKKSGVHIYCDVSGAFFSPTKGLYRIRRCTPKI